MPQALTHTFTHNHTTHIPHTNSNETKIKKIQQKRNKMKTQQNNKTIPNKAKSMAAAASPASLLVRCFPFKFPCAVVSSSEDPRFRVPGSLSSSLVQCTITQHTYRTQTRTKPRLRKSNDPCRRFSLSSNSFDVLSLLLHRIRVY